MCWILRLMIWHDLGEETKLTAEKTLCFLSKGAGIIFGTFSNNSNNKQKHVNLGKMVPSLKRWTNPSNFQGTHVKKKNADSKSTLLCWMRLMPQRVKPRYPGVSRSWTYVMLWMSKCDDFWQTKFQESAFCIGFLIFCLWYGGDPTWNQDQLYQLSSKLTHRIQVWHGKCRHILKKTIIQRCNG